VGEYNDASNHTHGFLFSGGTFTTLDDPLATAGTLALGINNAGQILGYYTNTSSAHGFLYSGGFYTTLDDPLATTETLAWGINDAGQIVGTYGDASGGSPSVRLTYPPAPPLANPPPIFFPHPPVGKPVLASP